MSTEPPPLAIALAMAAETIEFLASRAGLFPGECSTSVSYDRPTFQFELQDSTNRLQDSILQSARSTLHRLRAWSKRFVEIVAELSEIEALFQRVKSETSSSLVSNAFPTDPPYKEGQESVIQIGIPPFPESKDTFRPENSSITSSQSLIIEQIPWSFVPPSDRRFRNEFVIPFLRDWIS
jgi:hypothetical protein